MFIVPIIKLIFRYHFFLSWDFAWSFSYIIGLLMLTVVLDPLTPLGGVQRQYFFKDNVWLQTSL